MQRFDCKRQREDPPSSDALKQAKLMVDALAGPVFEAPAMVLPEGRVDSDDMTIKAERSQTSRNHVITEQRRRNKINQGFEALRALVPHSGKVDKAALLSHTVDYIAQTQGLLRELAAVAGAKKLPEDVQLRIQQLIPNQVPVVVVHSTQSGGGSMNATGGATEPTCTVTAVPWAQGSFQAPAQLGGDADGFPANLAKMLEVALQGSSCGGGVKQAQAADGSFNAATESDTTTMLGSPPRDQGPFPPALPPDPSLLQALAALAAQSGGAQQVAQQQQAYSTAARAANEAGFWRQILPPPPPLYTMDPGDAPQAQPPMPQGPPQPSQLALLSMLLRSQAMRAMEQESTGPMTTSSQ